MSEGLQCKVVVESDMPAEPKAGDLWRWRLESNHPELSKISPVLLQWRWIPPGTFRMGARGYYPDEEPVHDVTVRDGFWMLETPVTQAQWLAVSPPPPKIGPAPEQGVNPSFYQRQRAKDWDARPVENVTWFMARAWCEELGRLADVPNLKGPDGESSERKTIDLPTEAMWEYACRAGSETEYHNGDGPQCLERVGWFGGNSKSRTHRVGALEPNAWGLADMHGNVLEWCLDRWNAQAYWPYLDEEHVAEDVDLGEVSGENAARAVRPVRGGGCADPAVNCRSAYRDGGPASRGGGFDGFRACLLPGPVHASKESRERERRRPPRALAR